MDTFFFKIEWKKFHFGRKILQIARKMMHFRLNFLAIYEKIQANLMKILVV